MSVVQNTASTHELLVVYGLVGNHGACTTEQQCRSRVLFQNQVGRHLQTGARASHAGYQIFTAAFPAFGERKITSTRKKSQVKALRSTVKSSICCSSAAAPPDGPANRKAQVLTHLVRVPAHFR